MKADCTTLRKLRKCTIPSLTPHCTQQVQGQDMLLLVWCNKHMPCCLPAGLHTRFAKVATSGLRPLNDIYTKQVCVEPVSQPLCVRNECSRFGGCSFVALSLGGCYLLRGCSFCRLGSRLLCWACLLLGAALVWLAGCSRLAGLCLGCLLGRRLGCFFDT